MDRWIDLIFVGPGQLVPVVVGLVLWFALAGLGALVTGRDRVTEAAPFYGWAVISGVFTLAGIVFAAPFLALSIIAAIGAIFGIMRARRQREPLFIPGFWRVLVLAMPLLVIAGAMDPSQWDEFSHWLPAARFLFMRHGFPGAEDVFSGFPAYPYGWPILSYLSALVAGRFLDNIGGVLNVLMLLSLAVFALRYAFVVAGYPRARHIGWGFAAAVALVATILNPIFVQKIVLTAYSDISSAVATGLGVLLAHHLLDRLASGAPRRDVRSAAWELGLVLMLLINIRQPNLIVVCLILLGVVVIAWRASDLRLGMVLRHAPLAMLPPLVIYTAWRVYVGTEFAAAANPEQGLNPLASWNFADIPAILLGMLEVGFKKIGFFGPMVLACGFAIRGLIRDPAAFDRIAIFVAIVFAGYNAFLFVMYLGHFGHVQAITVVSFWRYNIDIGALAMVFLTAGAVTWLSRRSRFDLYPRWLTPTAVAVVLVLPLVLAHKLRFDLEPPKPQYILVAKDMREMGLSGARVFVIDPLGTGEAAVITRYHLDARGEAWLAAFQNPTPEKISAYAAQVPTEAYVLVHSQVPGVAEAMGHALELGQAYLFERQSDGWELLRTWTKPES